MDAVLRESMGEKGDWIEVAFELVLLGGWMLAWETQKRKAANVEPALLPASILIWILSGLAYCLITTFEWKAFHWPLVFLTAASLAGASVIGILYRRERGKAFNQRRSWWRIPAFSLWMAGIALFLFDKARHIAYLSLVAGGVLFLVDYFQSKGRESQALRK